MSKKGDTGRRKSKTKDHSKSDESEDSWVFDSLVGFLRGPVWCVPVMTFIEQKSLGNLFVMTSIRTNKINIHFRC